MKVDADQPDVERVDDSVELEQITAMAVPAPPYVTRFRLQCPVTWTYGRVLTEFTSTEEDVRVTPDVLFGGYIASLVDQQAGLAMYSVLPDDRTLLTMRLEVEFLRSLNPGDVRINSTIVSLSTREAECEVVLSQAGEERARARVTESFRSLRPRAS